MNSELATLAPLAGKKAFIFVSGGFEFQPGYAMASYALGQANRLALDTRNFSEELEQIVRRANAAEITFYTWTRAVSKVKALGVQRRPASGGPASPSSPARQPAGLVTLAHETEASRS